MNESKKLCNISGRDIPDPRFEGYGADRRVVTPTPAETAARIALQPPLHHIDPIDYEPPVPLDVVRSYRDKHYDVMGISRYRENKDGIEQ